MNKEIVQMYLQILDRLDKKSNDQKERELYTIVLERIRKEIDKL